MGARGEAIGHGVVHEAILRAVIDSTRDVVIFALDREYRYLVFNETHRQTMRKIWNVDIAIGQSMLEAIGREDDRLRAKANFDRALAGEHFMVIEEYGDERFSRRYYEDLYSPIVGEDGSVVGLTLFLTEPRGCDQRGAPRRPEPHVPREAVRLRDLRANRPPRRSLARERARFATQLNQQTGNARNYSPTAFLVNGWMAPWRSLSTASHRSHFERNVTAKE